MNPTLDAALRSWPSIRGCWQCSCVGRRDLSGAAGSACVGAILWTLDRRHGWPPFGAAWRRSIWPWLRRSSRSPRFCSAGPHAAARAADDGRAAAVLAGRAVIPACCGDCREPIRTVLDRAAVAFAVVASLFRMADPSGVALLVVCRRDWLWHLPAAYELALRSRGWHYVQHFVFSARGAVVLVSGGSALSGPAAMVALAAVPVSDRGRRAEHGALGLADIFRQAALSAIT